MKVLSVWQPYASLAVYRFKRNETRPYPVPKALIGQRIGIAATKIVKPEQRLEFNKPEFQKFYEQTELPPLDELPMGVLLGTAIVGACVAITEELIERISEEERAYGWWTPGRFAWGLVEPEAFWSPIPVRGLQGLWEWSGDIAEGQRRKV